MPASLSKNAREILTSRYLQKDKNGNIIESEDQLFRRVAKAVAKAELQYATKVEFEKWTDIFYQSLSQLDFLPNSPTLMNAGLSKGQLSACFVLPLEDSLKHIFSSLKNTALVHQSGGGTGFNFSKLRPKGDVVSGSAGISSGPVSFMHVFDAATEHIRQGGRRRGANMGILNINHPDIEDFVRAKSNRGILRNFNLSVGITDDFFEALEAQEAWPLINPRTGKTTRYIQAQEIWQLIIDQAWASGDPGLIFLDTINQFNPLANVSPLFATNPCGEMPLFDYESCNLGSINLSRMLSNGDDNKKVDWHKLKRTIEIAVRFLDNVIDVNHFILPKIATITRNNRKIGLGVMGWAELLIQLGIPYASEAAVTLAEKLMKFIKESSHQISQELAEQRGCFPNWEKSIFYPHQKMRNATVTSIAPTGTISTIAGTSSSIEPLFALFYKRIGILDNKVQLESNQLFIKRLKTIGRWEPSLSDSIFQAGNIKMLGLPENLERLFQTSLEIPYAYHLRHQIAFQKFTDNAVSKTINLPAEASKEDVADAYSKAWQWGAKGITVYRYGSHRKQVLQTGCKL